MNLSRLFATLLALASLSQGCHRMESRRPSPGAVPSSEGAFAAPASPSPMTTPSEGSGPIRGYRPSEGS